MIIKNTKKIKSIKVKTIRKLCEQHSIQIHSYFALQDNLQHTRVIIFRDRLI